MTTTEIVRLALLLSLLLASGCGPREPASPTQPAPADASPPTSAGESNDTKLPVETLAPDDEQQQAIQAIIAAGGSVDCNADGWPTLIDLASERASANDETVRWLLRFPQLKRLRLAVNTVSPETLSDLKTLVEMEELLLQDATIDDQQITTVLRSMPALRRLTMRRLSKVTDRGLAAISDCSQLEVLALIEMSQISGAALQPLSQVPQLRSLDLRNCGQLALADFEQLTSLAGLSELKLGGPAVTDDVLSVAAGLPSLVSLTIEDAQISGQGLQRLAQTPGVATRLRSLTIARCFGVTDDTLDMLGSLPVLETLSLRDIMLTGSFLKSLDESLGQSLEKPLSLTTLVVTDAFLTDEAIAPLPRIAPGLRRLDLRGNQGVTDQSLDVFRQLPQLKDLQLQGTGVSDPAAALSSDG